MAAGVYLHIPFCKSRCSYCDFATDIYRDAGAVDRYVNALCREIRTAFGQRDKNADSGVEIDTVYFGGGTPSLLTAEQAAAVMSAVRERFVLGHDAEITMEMNPATVTPEKLAAFREIGINRASFGVQTFNDRDLKLLARGHNANDARETYRMLREAGFAIVSFDLIAGLPGQSMDDWNRNLDEAITMQPEHLSLYLLEIHEGTPLAEQVRSGRRKPIDEELAAEMYELMIDRLAVAGYEQYEISNFAKPGFAARHNTKYWTLDPVFGFGVSAHSFDGAERYANLRDTSEYVRAVETTGTAENFRERITIESEAVFLGLRLNKGVDLADYSQRFGRDLLEEQKVEIGELEDAGLLVVTDGYLRLTPKGRLFSNDAFERFI